MLVTLSSQLSFSPGCPQPLGRVSPQKGNPMLLISPQLNKLLQLDEWESSRHRDMGISKKVTNNKKYKERRKGDGEKSQDSISVELMGNRCIN
jgi:hypothetical protein